MKAKQIECERCHHKFPEKDMLNHFGILLCKECIQTQVKYVYPKEWEKRWI